MPAAPAPASAATARARAAVRAFDAFDAFDAASAAADAAGTPPADRPDDRPDDLYARAAALRALLAEVLWTVGEDDGLHRPAGRDAPAPGADPDAESDAARRFYCGACGTDFVLIDPACENCGAPIGRAPNA